MELSNTIQHGGGVAGHGVGLLSYMWRGPGQGAGTTILYVEGGLGMELVLLYYMYRGPWHGAGITILHVEGAWAWRWYYYKTCRRGLGKELELLSYL